LISACLARGCILDSRPGGLNAEQQHHAPLQEARRYRWKGTVNASRGEDLRIVLGLHSHESPKQRNTSWCRYRVRHKRIRVRFHTLKICDVPTHCVHVLLMDTGCFAPMLTSCMWDNTSECITWHEIVCELRQPLCLNLES